MCKPNRLHTDRAHTLSAYDAPVDSVCVQGAAARCQCFGATYCQCFPPPFWNWYWLPILLSMALSQPEGGRSQEGMGEGLCHFGTRAVRRGLYQQGTPRHCMPITPHFLSANCRGGGGEDTWEAACRAGVGCQPVFTVTTVN
jgi:hypothetical protein